MRRATAPSELKYISSTYGRYIRTHTKSESMRGRERDREGEEMTFVQVNAIHGGDAKRVAHTCQRGSARSVDGEYKSQTRDAGSISPAQKDFCIPVVGPICGNANKTPVLCARYIQEGRDTLC